MKKLASIICLAAELTTLTGCASIVNGNQQSISVKTGEIHGATCSLENNRGTWYVNQTPASVTVHRSYDSLKIACEKRGVGFGQTQVASHTKGMAFGNILFGGVIGAGVDMADGAAYDYPTNINVPMARRHLS